MKYDPGINYDFECEVSVSGINASNVELLLKETLKEIIKNHRPSFASLSNEVVSKKDQRLKLFSIIEDLQILKGSEIVHVGRIPENVLDELKEEMESKEELSDKRWHHIKDCIMISVKDNSDKIVSIVLDRRGVYSLSKKISNSK